MRPVQFAQDVGEVLADLLHLAGSKRRVFHALGKDGSFSLAWARSGSRQGFMIRLLASSATWAEP